VLKRRVPIVSTTEELAYPWHSNNPLAKKIDDAARSRRRSAPGSPPPRSRRR